MIIVASYQTLNQNCHVSAKQMVTMLLCFYFLRMHVLTNLNVYVLWKQALEACSDLVYPLTWLGRLGCNQDSRHWIFT